MNTPPNAKITVFCPAGHRLRGGTELVGKQVRCPRCETQFVFAPTASAESLTTPSNSPQPSPRSAVTESRVMAILGEMQQSTSSAPGQPNSPQRLPRPTVTESRVMAILGEMQKSTASAPDQPEPSQLEPSRPCVKCDGAVSESLSVCPHCNAYVGLMPMFMRELRHSDGQSPNDGSLG